MKKLIALFLLMITIWSLASLPATQIASARPIQSIQTAAKRATDKTVYIIKKDKTYHRSRCKHHSFNIKTTQMAAKKSGYTPCRICRP